MNNFDILVFTSGHSLIHSIIPTLSLARWLVPSSKKLHKYKVIRVVPDKLMFIGGLMYNSLKVQKTRFFHSVLFCSCSSTQLTKLVLGLVGFLFGFYFF